MEISIQECRKILGKEGEGLTDAQIEELKNVFVVLSDLAIDDFLVKRKKDTHE